MQAATPKHYINLKKQLAARQEGGWARVVWGYAQQPSPYDIHLLQARLLMLDPKVLILTLFAGSCLERACRYRAGHGHKCCLQAWT